MSKYNLNIFKQLLDTDYTLQELENKILEILKLHKGHVNVFSISGMIIDTALEEGRIIGQVKNAQYWDYSPSDSANEKVFKVLQKLAIEQKILYCFNSSFKLWE